MTHCHSYQINETLRDNSEILEEQKITWFEIQNYLFLVVLLSDFS